MFASAFPLAAFLSLLYNLIEIKSDLLKVCYIHRRPRVLRPATIGAWGTVLRIQAWLAVVTNIALVAFASDQFRHLVPQVYTEDYEEESMCVVPESALQRCPDVWLLIQWEHLLVLLLLLIAYCIPDYTQKTKVQLRRQRYARERGFEWSLQTSFRE